MIPQRTMRNTDGHSTTPFTSFFYRISEEVEERRMSLVGHSRPSQASSKSSVAVESGSELSYRDATGTNTMPETVTIDRPSVAKPVSRPRSRKPATVSASALTYHLDCSRTYIAKLEAEGVIQRQGDGYPLDASRVAYLRFLRRERQRSPRSEADSAFAAAKTRLVMLRVQERERSMIAMAEVNEIIDRIMGILLTALSGLPARVAGYDLALRRKIEKIIFEVRTEIAEAATALADQRGEPLEPDAA
jgi:hypothetical protein